MPLGKDGVGLKRKPASKTRAKASISHTAANSARRADLQNEILFTGSLVLFRRRGGNSGVASKLLNPELKDSFAEEIRSEYQSLREKGRPVQREIVSLDDARNNKLNLF